MSTTIESIVNILQQLHELENLTTELSDKIKDGEKQLTNYRLIPNEAKTDRHVEALKVSYRVIYISKCIVLILLEIDIIDVFTNYCKLFIILSQSRHHTMLAWNLISSQNNGWTCGEPHKAFVIQLKLNYNTSFCLHYYISRNLFVRCLQLLNHLLVYFQLLQGELAALAPEVVNVVDYAASLAKESNDTDETDNITKPADKVHERFCALKNILDLECGKLADTVQQTEVLQVKIFPMNEKMNFHMSSEHSFFAIAYNSAT